MKNSKKNKSALLKSSPEELKKKLGDLREALRAVKWKSEGAKSKNVKEEKALRRDIARALTFINTQK